MRYRSSIGDDLAYSVGVVRQSMLRWNPLCRKGMLESNPEADNKESMDVCREKGQKATFQHEASYHMSDQTHACACFARAKAPQE